MLGTIATCGLIAFLGLAGFAARLLLRPGAISRKLRDDRRRDAETAARLPVGG